MRLNKLTVVIGSTCLSLLLVGSAFAASASNVFDSSATKSEIISSSFDDLKVMLDQENNTRSIAVVAPLVHGGDFQISKQDFIFYKSNMEMINKLQNISSLKSVSLSDDSLIGEMVKKEVTVSYAKKLGLEVTPQEVDAVIQQERSFLNDPSITGENNDTVREIMKNRIRITGLSEDEFWNSDQTRKEYEKALLIGKLFDKLVADGEIEKDNGADFGNYQKKILESYKGEVIVDKSVLNN
ncbi:hypothetical protein [Paenibacillus sp.]|jgi:hypothetical protein|uniref:hypothetical protein n=1 Tax=Paenibacillus sp. TaxID=58172 RepID=UPI0028270CFF|nr:hypothetical protein [Paenibacillus sp.]MDR0267083.1 SurA N-terminal domain-containing protein [Paenibacillus sp.]